MAQLYAAHSGLLAASEGEGFGLPIIEAARAGLPVLARDIPVFREVAGDHAVWFGKQPGTLAESLRVWGERARTGTLPSAEGITCLNWDQSTQAFLRQIRSADWPMTWTPASWARPP